MFTNFLASKNDQTKKTDTSNLPYKQRKSLVRRKQEVQIIRERYPGRIPVIVERHKKEKDLPRFSRGKFLVPSDLTVSQLVTVIRGRWNLLCNQTFYLLINGRAMASMSLTLAEVYSDYCDEDGFLYMTYASQETFG